MFYFAELRDAAPAGAASLSAETIQSVVRSFMAKNHFKAVIVQVRSNGADVYTGAFGDSMTGVPATPEMHFRNGALAFTYMSTLLLKFVDQKKTTLDTKLSAYFPELPNAQHVTLRELAQMTSGYADYVYQPEMLDGYNRDPFRQWTPAELIHIGVSKPMEFAPGTNWGYSHTNYVILGGVLAKIAGMPLADAIRQNVLEPMGLTQTAASTTPAIPAPALHAFTSERREALGIKPDVPFTRKPRIGIRRGPPSRRRRNHEHHRPEPLDRGVAAGKLLSPASSRAQIVPSVLGLGHKQSGCNACFAQTKAFNYGLGVILTGRGSTRR